MNRRFFIQKIFGGLLLLVFVLVVKDELIVFLRKVRNKFQKNVNATPFEQRHIVALDTGQREVSVEKALNSRCTSDYNGKQTLFHWGMFDADSRFSDETLDYIRSKVNGLPSIFRDNPVSINKNYFTFSSDARLDGRKKELAMIQSGVRQQAMGMICTALGAGYAFKGIGRDGKISDEKTHGHVNIKVNPTLPPYGQEYWTDSIPSKEKPWKQGNLPDPRRDGNVPFMEVLEKFSFNNLNGGIISSNQDLGQLLWAARGRTPHLYLSKPWGMTIPAYNGEQSLSQIMVLTKSAGYSYQNWNGRYPTHSLARYQGNISELINIFDKIDRNGLLILLCRNEDHARSFWEIGHQLFNIVLQALCLNLSFEVLTDHRFDHLNGRTLNNGTATLSIAFKTKKGLIL